MVTYIKESLEELRNNVTWLERSKASNLMVIVAVFSILFALATWGVDSLFSKLITLYFEKLIVKLTRGRNFYVPTKFSTAKYAYTAHAIMTYGSRNSYGRTIALDQSSSGIH